MFYLIVHVLGTIKDMPTSAVQLWGEDAAEDGLDPWRGPGQKQRRLPSAPHAGCED